MRLERWCRKPRLPLTLAVGDFCEGGSSSESPSGAREVLSSEIRFAWLPSPQGCVQLPRRRWQLRDKSCAVEVGAGPKARGVPGCWDGAGSHAGDAPGESGLVAVVAWRPWPWWGLGGTERCLAKERAVAALPHACPGQEAAESRAGGCCCCPPRGRRPGGMVPWCSHGQPWELLDLPAGVGGRGGRRGPGALREERVTLGMGGNRNRMVSLRSGRSRTRERQECPRSCRAGERGGACGGPSLEPQGWRWGGGAWLPQGDREV